MTPNFSKHVVPAERGYFKIAYAIKDERLYISKTPIISWLHVIEDGAMGDPFKASFKVATRPLLAEPTFYLGGRWDDSEDILMPGDYVQMKSGMVLPLQEWITRKKKNALPALVLGVEWTGAV